jgi:site-specific DNA-methyltransferase (adenine-specific)
MPSHYNYNPDVLSCLANLSSDEVFTPPQMANQMLDMLPATLWSDPSATFLDPVCKSGVFLREIAKRLDHGLEAKIPDKQKRINHIFTKQLFGLAITELTALLARRSVYCSKVANGKYSVCDGFADPQGNIRFERVEHVWDKGRCRFCGASQENYERGEELETHAYQFIHTDKPEEIFDMKFDVIIGNPPYQLGQSGGEAVGGFAMPIYQEFVRAAKRLNPRYVVMITPSRWFAGGRGLDEFRKEMLSDKRMCALVDFPDAAEAFPGIQIKGGVSYFLWDNSWNDGCKVTTIYGGKPTSPPMKRHLDAYDILVRRNEAVAILEKILKRNAKDGFGNLSAKVSPIQPFSIRTNFRGATSPKGMKKPVRLIGKGDATYIERADVPRNDGWIDEWKVLLGAAYGAGDSFPHQIYNYPIIAGPGTACTETYLVIDRFKAKVRAERFSGYLRTRLVRFLVSLRKYTQHLYNERFQFVPDLPMNHKWTDETLYKKYAISKSEIAFIESMVRPMESNGDDAPGVSSRRNDRGAGRGADDEQS